MSSGNTINSSGFGLSDVKSFVIPSGTSGSAVAPLDMGRPYFAYLVYCENTTGIAAATNITCEVATIPGQTMCSLYELNDPGTEWSKGAIEDGSSETFAFTLTHTFGARYLRFVLSNNTTENVTIKVIGLSQGVI